MTTKELRELDAWIAEHVMGFLKSQHEYVEQLWVGEEWNHEPFSPTTDPAAAMAVLKKCAMRLGVNRVHIYGPLIGCEF